MQGDIALLEGGNAVEVDDDILGIGALQCQLAGECAMRRGAEGDRYRLPGLSLGDGDAGGTDGEHIVGIGLGDIDLVGEVRALDDECGCCRFAGVASHVQVGNRAFNHGTHIFRLDANDHLLPLVEGVAVTVREGVHHTPVVAVTTPSEVDVILIVTAAITVHVECMSTTAARHSCVDDRTALGHFGLQQVCPVGCRVAALTDHATSGLIVAEKDIHVHDVLRVGGVDATAASSRGAIHHVLGLTHIAHQGSHGVALSRGVVAVGVLHVVPIEGHRRQCGVGEIDTVPVAQLKCSCVAGQCRHGLFGPLPVVKHHRGRCRWAASETLVGGATIGELALVPVGRFLVPQRSQQGPIGASHCLGWRSTGDFLNFCIWVCDEPVKLVLVHVKPSLHIGRELVGRQWAVADGQDFLGTVVTRNDDKVG